MTTVIETITASADRVEHRLTTHRCPVCGEHKPSDQFPPAPSRVSGRNGYCRDCHRDTVRAYRQTDAGKEANRRSSRESKARKRRTTGTSLESA
jgi:hypothetical protein